MVDAEKAGAERILVDVYSQEKEKVSSVELNPDIFATEVKTYLLWEVVNWQEAKHRQGTAKVKTRGEVSGTGKKPWRQKGTGRSRHGSLRSPLWPGGGKVFGPVPRDYDYTIPKKVKKNALRGALSLKLKDNKLLILDRIKMDEIKTKKFKEILDRFELGRALFLTGERDEKLKRSARNIPEVKILSAEGANVRDILRYDWLVFDLEGLKKLSEALK